MPVELYGMSASAPCRIVAMTLEVLEVPYEYKTIDLMAGDQMKPEYLKINPQHNIPTLVDGDFAMNESRAIATYLANAYGKDSKLYPVDPKVRAVVDQRLYFDMGVFYKAIGDIIYPKMFEGKDPESGAKDKLKEVLGWVNDMIKKSGYAAGTDSLTLADLAFIASFSTLVETGSFDVSGFAELNAWFEKVKGEIKNYEKANGAGATAMGQWYKSKL
ncbi:hypothetical protein TCAL_07652 [Tigriopus californicus]|uniref:Uncharacterized protein n=1 Tax=Tigriopus californicus TaxID=6832 RepID=A0A553NNG9_TIGCA|nr:glutathione S-transferase 1-like [Tigriopus californicus]TRY66937.1 hypothetical protein TCAL_07652 [Tigriopus californicus]|eukprot:TCALIF_07652-PA protein Name:"Similar to GstD1 Glutathione S-transferase 1, isoform C (Anopheles gambiae)" AED:0.21 eAED:0.21 QI:287/1/1/1/0.5/0.33/3/149/216